MNKYRNNKYNNIIDKQNYNKRELLELHFQRNYVLKKIKNKKKIIYNESIELPDMNPNYYPNGRRSK